MQRHLGFAVAQVPCVGVSDHPQSRHPRVAEPPIEGGEGAGHEIRKLPGVSFADEADRGADVLMMVPHVVADEHRSLIVSVGEPGIQIGAVRDPLAADLVEAGVGAVADLAGGPR